MSIAKKLLKIAENEQKVYDAGKKSVVAESKVIESTASNVGSVHISEISEVSHDISVEVISDLDIAVRYCGKNLIGFYDYSASAGSARVNEITDGVVTVYAKASFSTTVVISSEIYPQVGRSVYDSFPAGTYSFSAQNVTTEHGKTLSVYIELLLNDGTSRSIYSGKSAHIPQTFNIVAIRCGSIVFNADDSYTSSFQFEAGGIATEYEPYQEFDYLVTAEESPHKKLIRPISDAMSFKTAYSSAQIIVTYKRSYGRYAEWSEFWDGFQQNGERTNYDKAFAGVGWTGGTFDPKYSMNVTNGYMMFNGSRIDCDLVDFLEKRGLTLTINYRTDARYMFSNTLFTRIGVVDLTEVTEAYTAYLFQNSSNLETIDLLILADKPYQNTTIFQNCSALKNLRIQGVVASNFDARWCPLSVDSLMSIINALKDYSETGGTYTLTIGSTNLAKLTDAEKAIATQKGWTLA